MSDPLSRLQRIYNLFRSDPDCACTIVPLPARPIIRVCGIHAEYAEMQVADGNLIAVSDGYTVPLVRP